MPSKCNCEHFSRGKFLYSPLSKDHIQGLRQWRNEASLSGLMIVSKRISVKEQDSWFQSLDQYQHYYELRYDMRFVAVLQVKNIDRNCKSGEAGIIMNPEVRTPATVLTMAILMFYQRYFIHYKFESLTAKVKKSNKSMIKLNLDLGYKVKGDYTDYLSLTLNASRFLNKNRRLLEFLQTFQAS